MRCRTEISSHVRPSEWNKFGYAFRDVLDRPILYDSQTVPIPRVKWCDVTDQWFEENFARQNRPVILEDAAAHWPAMNFWTIDKLEKRFRHDAFIVGSSVRNDRVRMKFKHFVDYMLHQADDSPLYLFEQGIGDHARMKELLHDFKVLGPFSTDWFDLLNHDARPPHQWFCIGPRRSGSSLHVDPLGTSAWLALTHGRKRWVLFEPSVKRTIAIGATVKPKADEDEAMFYFDFLLPRIKRAHPELHSYEGLQRPGDVIFIPSGWHHAALNVEDSIAITQNFCGSHNFDEVWRRVRSEREKLAFLWLRNMMKYAPEQYKRVLEINVRDGFRMRHERGPGESLQSLPSGESSDSSSDSDNDIRCARLARANALRLAAPTPTSNKRCRLLQLPFSLGECRPCKHRRVHRLCDSAL